MRSKIIYIVLAISLLGLMNCVHLTDLPKDVPDNFEIKYIYPQDDKENVRSVVVSNGKMLVEFKDGTNKSYDLSADAVSAIYRDLVETKFDLIENETTDKILDKTIFEQIILRAGTISKDIKYGVKFPLSKENTTRFNRARIGITEYLYDKVSPEEMSK